VTDFKKLVEPRRSSLSEGSNRIPDREPDIDTPKMLRGPGWDVVTLPGAQLTAELDVKGLTLNKSDRTRNVNPQILLLTHENVIRNVPGLGFLGKILML
jgi:hypothetical protein